MKKILKIIPSCCDKGIVFLLLLASIIIPLFFDIRIYSVFDLSKVTVLYLITIAILAVWILTLSLQNNIKFLHIPISIPILAYITVFIISALLSINPIVSFLGTYKRFEGLIATLCYILLFYATVNFVTTRKRFYSLLCAIIITAIVSSFYGIVQHLGYDIFTWSSFEAHRVFSTFGNPVFFSAYLVMLIPVVIALFFAGSSQENVAYKRPTHRLFFLASLILYTAFWLTNTRACFVALLGGLGLLLFFVYKMSVRRQIRGRLKFIVLITSFVLIGIFFNIRQDTSVIKHFTNDIKTDLPVRSTQTGQIVNDAQGEKIFTAKDGSGHTLQGQNRQNRQRPWIASKFSVTGSSFSRIFQYLVAIEIVRDYPVLGIGPDTIGIIYQKNLAKVFSLQESDNGFPFPRQDRIHNDILDTLVTRGLLGLGTYIWLLVAFWVYAIKNYKNLDDKNRLLLLGLLSGITCYLIQNEFSFGNTPIVSLFWIMMGLCISLIHLNKQERRQEDNEQEITSAVKYGRLVSVAGIRKWLYCTVLLSALGYASIFILGVYKADACFEQGRRMLSNSPDNAESEKINNTIRLFKQAIYLNPYEPFYRDELCRVYITLAFKTKHEAWIKEAYTEAVNTLKLIPQHHTGYFHLGMIHQFLAEGFNYDTIDKAIFYYKKAIETDPFQASYHYNIASLYIQKNMLDEAVQELYQAYLIRPHEVNYVERLAGTCFQKGDLDNACYFARKAIEMEPNNAVHLYNLGIIYKRKKQSNNALQSFQKAVDLKPDNPVYVDIMATTLMERNQYHDAIKVLQKFNSAFPEHNYIPIFLHLAELYFKNAEWEKMISVCKKAISIDTNSVPAYRMLGIAYYNSHRYKLAEESLKRVLAIDQDIQDVKDLLAKISEEKNKTGEGISSNR